jgi:hypothetical protein
VLATSTISSSDPHVGRAAPSRPLLRAGIRVIPDDPRTRHTAQGWWTSEPLLVLISRGLHAVRDRPFRVHSAARPYAATMRDVEDIARRCSPTN